MASVSLQKVSKVYDGGVVAVRDFDIDVADREFMVIVGPSGCGKTSLLRMIAGLEDLSDGTIRFDSEDVTNVQPRDRDVAMVFQNYSLYPHMNVYENMAFSLKVRKLARDRIRADVESAARMLGIEDLLRRKPRELSGGQRQRVALGRAIVRKPAVFLFDEPLSNLDARLRATMRAELKLMHRKLAATCIYVTHDQTEAMTLGDRICVMNAGSVRQIGTPMEVYDRPADRFVAGFVGSPAMNFFDGRVELRDNRVRFLAGDTGIPLRDNLAESLERYNGRDMVLGFRPENVMLGASNNASEETLDCTVRLVEPLGDRTDVVLDSSGGLELTARVDPHLSIAAADAIQVRIDTSKTHIFEPGSDGANVTL